MTTASTLTTGAEDVRWDLSDLYTGVEDAAIDRDLRHAVNLAERFAQTHRGHLHETLGQALEDQGTLQQVVEKLLVYLFLQRSTHAGDARVQQRIAEVQEAWSVAEADHLNFFEHELVALEDAVFERLAETDARIKHHLPMLQHIRDNARYLLNEDIERALTLRGPFGPAEWSDYTDELEAELSFSVDGQALSLPQILHMVNNHVDGDQRAHALKTFSEGLHAQRFDRFMARTLNVIVGAKGVEDRERGYKTPMSARNIHNKVDDATVEALHDAVADQGARQARRYYRLLAAHLGLKTLRWSDRNAPLPFADTRVIPWDECVSTVLAAYRSFSPTLAGLVHKMIDSRWVDAPPSPGKVGGAFNYSVLLPGGDARAYNFLNYLGSTRDVMTVAHELGHGVHGILAAEAQGTLMFRAPMAYAETASIFGEMTTFEHLLAQASGDQQKLALLMGKINDLINSVVRQISFSRFERQVHAQRKKGKLTLGQLNELWLQVTEDFYGPPGDIFSYEHVENLWCYVTHFLRPFYVYAYAFGELFTQTLCANRPRMGDAFETTYLALLRAGGSKDAVALMAPFALDPRDPAFWTDGIDGSLTRWLDEAEAISERMGIAATAPKKQ